MKSRGILNISVNRLVPHPENPRKNIGDISEMTESIRKNGVLQNLTVIPKNADETDADGLEMADHYVVIIGHRRLEAARAAGIDSVPCRVVAGMTHEEQLLTMLEENMQRSDLTPYDQAQGFQLMLDLGQTVEDIEEKSGFSKTTIYHRLNMAKLDKDLLKEKQEDDSFQLSISDLIELEKVKDIEKRNEILKKAKNSQELKYQANAAAKEEERAEKTLKITTILEGLGIKELPKNLNWWSCNKRYTIPLSEYGNVEIDVVEGEVLYYHKGWDAIDVYEPPCEDDSDEGDDPEPAAASPGKWDKYQRAKKDVIEACERFTESRKDAFTDIALGKLKPANEEDAKTSMWSLMLQRGANIELEDMTQDWADINQLVKDDMEQEEVDEVFDKARNEVLEMGFIRQCALLMAQVYFEQPVSVYSATLLKDAKEHYKIMDEALRNFGFSPSKMDEDLLDENGHLLSVLQRRKREYES